MLFFGKKTRRLKMKDKKQKHELDIEVLLKYANGIIATLREPFLVLDKDLRVVSANPVFYNTFKVAEKDTIGQRLPDLGNKQWNIPKLHSLLKEALSKKKIVKNYEVEHKFEQIGQRAMRLNACQLCVSKEVAKKIMGRVRTTVEAEEELILLAIEDITERKKEQIKEQQYRALIESLPQKIFLKDRNLVYVSCNEHYARDLKIKPEEIAGKTDYDFFPTYLAEKYRADDKRIMDSGQTENIEEEYLVITDFLKERKEVFVNTVKVPVLDKTGNIIGIFGIFWDITERKKAELEREVALKWQEDVNMLRQSLLIPDKLENKLKAITDSIVRIFNADFCRIWLIRPGDLCEKGCIHAQVTEGPHVCCFRDKCLHLIASSGRYTHIDGKGHARVPFGCYKIGRIASGEDHKFLTNDVAGDPRVHNHEWARQLGLVSFAGFQLKVPGGETMGVLGLFAKHPITPAEDVVLDGLSVTAGFVIQQAAAFEEIIQARAIKASSEIKTNFTDMVSHELRTPLAAIKESVTAVLDKIIGNINQEQKKYLEIAKNNVDRLERLVNGVLDFHTLESGKMEFRMEEDDINEVIKEIQQTMSPLAEKKNLDFACQLDEHLPSIKFDHDQIIQVLINLVNNALKFTEKGGIAITTTVGNNFIRVTVKDTGMGIKKEDMPKLFQQFTQLQRKAGGTGLGLSICKKIIEAHRGKIWAESEFGKGTAFHFILPVKEPRA